MDSIQMQLTVCRYSITGSFGYAAMAEGQEVFHVRSAVIPHAPVLITGRGFAFHSRFDPDTTLCPGFTTRKIQDAAGNAAGKLRWNRDGSYTLYTEACAYTILPEDGDGFSVWNGEKTVLQLCRIQKPTQAQRSLVQRLGSDCSAYFMLSYDAVLPLAHAALCTAYPLLKFGY